MLLPSWQAHGHRCQWAACGQPVQYHGRCYLGCGKSILCDSYVTSVPHTSLHLSTLVDTRAKTEHLNGWGKRRGRVPLLAELPNWHAALQQELEKSFPVHVPKISKNIYVYAPCNCWHILHLHAWLRTALGASKVGVTWHQKSKWEARRPQHLESLFASISLSEERQPKTKSIISLKTSFTVSPAVGDRRLCYSW